jgi:hypothetical protein
MHAAPSAAIPVSDETLRSSNHLLRQQDTSAGRVRKPTLQLQFPASRRPPTPGFRDAAAASIRQSDMAVTVLRSFSLESAFKVSPPFHHPGKKIRVLRINRITILLTHQNRMI